MPEVSVEFRENYELLRELGRGGMGSVWLARQVNLRREVAVKFVLGPEEAARRFEREAKIMAELTHPNLVGVIDSGVDSGRAYIVLEFVDGESLEHRLQREGKLPESVALPICEQVLGALTFIHQQGVLHRDIKPGNVLLGRDGTAKLSDFGLARWTDRESTFQTREGLVPGSPVYMSPELLLEGKADVSSDLWAMAVTIFQLVSGQLPFRGAEIPTLMGQILNRDPFEDPALEGAFSPGLLEFLRTALSKTRPERYTDAPTFLAALRRSRVRASSAARSAARRTATQLTSSSQRRVVAPTATIATDAAAQTLAPPARLALPFLGFALVAATALALAVAWTRAPSRIPEAGGTGPGLAAEQPRPEMRATLVHDVDLIVRAAMVTVRFTSESPARFHLRSGETPSGLAVASMDDVPSTTHLLRIKGLAPGRRCCWSLTAEGAEATPSASGEVTTLTEKPYWDKPAFQPRAGRHTFLGKNGSGYDEYRNELDGTVMILVPGAEFVMGDRSLSPDAWSSPAHRVRVDSFLLDKVPVTRARYRTFLKATGYKSVTMDTGGIKQWGEQPVSYVNWPDSSEYCRWAGKRLPTEAEWELAAGAAAGRTYPWGNTPPSPNLQCDWYGPHPPEGAQSRPVGSFPKYAGPFGHLDLAGGVRQWCADWIDEDYYSRSPRRNPMGGAPSWDMRRAVRGASYDANAVDFKLWHRFHKFPILKFDDGLGFRGARDL